MLATTSTPAAIQDHEVFQTPSSKTWHFNFSVIDDPVQLLSSFALRYEVYCKERHFLSPENYPSASEMDQYDENAIHVAGTNQDDLMVGTVRLVLPSSNGFPLFEHCEIFPGFEHLCDKGNQETTAEISRLAISKFYRRRQNDGFYGFDHKTDFDRIPNQGEPQLQPPGQTPQRRNKPEIVLGLYRTLYQASKRRGITHWFAAMEDSLIRLLRRYNIGFSAIGPELDYFGPVTPYIAEVSAIEECVYRNCPEMFAEFIKGLEPELVPEYAKIAA